MIKWVLTLSVEERWLYGIIVTGIFGVLTRLLFQRVSHTLSLGRDRRKDLIPEAKAFRSVINIEPIMKLKGHELHSFLIAPRSKIEGAVIEGEFFKHKRAVQEFKIYLGALDRIRLNMAWKKYHGGNEDNPDIFRMYCVPDSGNKLLKQRLEALRNIGNRQ